MAEFDETAVQDATGSDADSTPADGEETAPEPTVAEALAELKKLQSQFDRRFRVLEQDHPRKLREIEEQNGHIRTILADHDSRFTQYEPFWKRYVEDLDPAERQALKVAADVETNAQLVKVMAAQQARSQQPRQEAQNEGQALWEEACTDPETGLEAYAKSRKVNFDALYNEHDIAQEFPRRQGEKDASYVRRLDIIFRGLIDTKATDLRKREAATVKAGADTKGGGVGTKDYRNVAVKDIPDGEFVTNMADIARSMIANRRG